MTPARVLPMPFMDRRLFRFALATCLLLSSVWVGAMTPEVARGELAKRGIKFTTDEFIWRAWKHADPVVIDLFLAAGMKPDAANMNGTTALTMTAVHGRLEIAKKLLAAGASPNPPIGSGETPLMAAARNRHFDIATLLLAKGADPNTTRDGRHSALHNAVENGDSNLAALLLQHRAKTTIPDIFGRTPSPLHCGRKPSRSRAC